MSSQVSVPVSVVSGTGSQGSVSVSGSRPLLSVHGSHLLSQGSVSDPLGVNVGAPSSSGLGAGRGTTFSVVFVDHDTDIDDDKESVSSEKVAPSESFCSVLKLLFQLCPEV